MKRKFTFLLMALLALAGFKSWGQETILSESFDSNSLPSGWTMTGDGTGNWSISTYNNAGGLPNELKLDWSPQFNGIARFVSPTVNLAGFENVVVSFKHCLSNYSGSHILGVATSSDGGTTWNVGWSGTYSTSGNYSVSQEIATADMGQPAVQFCIYYQGNSYNINQWYFDDILITGTSSGSCPRPSGLTASIVKATSATITWNGSADSYKVVCGPAEGFNPDMIQPETISETSYTINGLTTDVTYSIAVKAVCSDEEESDWSQVYSFTPTCPTVNINQWNIETTAVTAYIPWSVEGYAESFSLAYGLADGFNLGGAGTYTLVENITDAYYELDNLTAGTEYKCAVKALCDGNTEGNWSNVVSFTPSCPAPSLNSYSGINLTPTTATISWNSNKDFIENYTLVYGLAETFDLENSSTYNSVNVVPDEYGYASYTIQNLTTNVSYKCAARSSCDGSTQSVWSNVVTFMPFIEAPNGLTVSNIKATSVTASWDASENAVTYTVAYGLANGFNLNDPTTYQTTEPTSATSIEITGLTADQNYACAVKSKNAESIDSKWSNPVYFMPTAKQTLVANDGTNYYNHAPFYGGGIVEGKSSGQFIIPASELQQMSGSSILSFEFSLYSGPWHQCQGNWEVYLEEVENTTYSSASFIEDNTMQLVYSGDFYVSDKLSVTFTTPFEYNGGNLMVYFKQTQAATSWDVWTPWYGVETSDYTSIGYEDYNYQINLYRYNFLPKTTITYIPAEKFAITLVQPEDEDEVGTIAANMPEAAEGKTVTLSFNPKQYDDHSYRVSSWNVKKTDDEAVTVEVADNNTFVMPAYPVTISAVIETVTYYALTVDEEIEGGSIEAYPAEHIEFGQQVELNASPALHYKFVEWNITDPSGDAFPVPALPNTTFNMPASALNVSATFEAYLPHTITLPDAVAEGYVTASQTEGLYCYDNVTLTVHPAEHCSLQSIAIMTGETPVSYNQYGNDYYFTMPDGDVTVTATFVENSKYNVTLVYNEEGGSITLQGGNTEYYAGDPVNLSVAANTGYILLSLEAEDSEHNPVTITNNQFVMPESAVTVTAVFVHGITVNDGNNTNEFVPFYGYYADDLTKSQFIIPASQIRDLQGGDINSMVFYLSSLEGNITDHHFDGTWDVYITEVDVNQTTLSGYETSEMTKVYSGNMDIVGLKMTVNFNENESSYSYRNGNLLIYFQQTIKCSGYNYKRTFWYGVNQSSNTAYAGYGSYSHSPRQFLPKVTFLYEPGEPLSEYNITFHSNGVVSEPQTLTEGQSLPNPTNIPAGLTFAGWAAADIATYTEVEPEYVTAARAEEDLYAVFSYSETETASKGAGSWIKVTDVNELANDDKVVFVYNNSKIMCDRSGSIYNGYFNPADVTVLDNVITSVPDNAVEFTLQSDGNNWKLKYVDALEDGETTLAYNKENNDLYPKNYEYASVFPDIWTAESNSGAVVFKETNSTRYIAYNSGSNKMQGHTLANACHVYKAGAPVVTKTYYMTEVLTDGEIAANTTAKNIVITTGTVIVDNNIVLTMNGNGLFRNKNAANFVFGYGAQLITDNTGVIATFKKHINGNNWYTISSPLAANTAFANVENLIPGNDVTNTSYDLYRLNEAEGIWENARVSEGVAFTTIDKGRGYLYANATGIDHIAFAGEVNVADVECTLTNSVTNGFNLIGNPFTQNIELANVTGVTLADGFYVLSNEGDWGPKLKGIDIKPLQGFLVQATTVGTATIEKPAASSKGERSNEQNTNIEMIVSNSNHRDNAYAVFGEGIGLNKVNHRNAQAPMLYVPQDGEDFAIAFMDENTTVFPLNFKAMTTGNYSISLKATDDINTLVLVDNMTGVETNMLLEGSYSFIGSPADNDSRFTVKLSISHNNGQADNEHFVYQNGSELVVNGEGTLQIFDVLGRVVVSEEVHGQTVYVGNLSTGAYIVRMTGENVRTQKIVLK